MEPAQSSPSVVSVDRLTRRYGRRVGVAQLSFNVPEGSLFGFLGPNGSGKTTTIRVLLGLLRPNEGTARIFERDCWRDGHHIKADLGYLPGSGAVTRRHPDGTILHDRLSKSEVSAREEVVTREGFEPTTPSSGGWHPLPSTRVHQHPKPATCAVFRFYQDSTQVQRSPLASAW